MFFGQIPAELVQVRSDTELLARSGQYEHPHAEIGIEPVWTQNTPIAVPLPGGRRAAIVGAGWRSSFAILA